MDFFCKLDFRFERKNLYPLGARGVPKSPWLKCRLSVLVAFRGWMCRVSVSPVSPVGDAAIHAPMAERLPDSATVASQTYNAPESRRGRWRNRPTPVALVDFRAVSRGIVSMLALSRTAATRGYRKSGRPFARLGIAVRYSSIERLPSYNGRTREARSNAIPEINSDGMVVASAAPNALITAPRAIGIGGARHYRRSLDEGHIPRTTS